MNHLTNQEVPIPMRFEMIDDYSGYQISWKWFNWTYVFLLVFCIFWFGFIIIWYAIALFGMDHAQGDSLHWIPLVVPLLHVLVGCGLLYSTLCGFINRTSISLLQDTLRVRHYPLPWMGNLTLAVSDIKQFYVKKRLIRTKNGTKIRYILYTVNSFGRAQKIVTLHDLDEAQYLEYIFEKKLGIKNEAVMGEYKS